MGVSESMSVELQRSMDFFESQLRQAPVKKILLHLDTEASGTSGKAYSRGHAGGYRGADSRDLKR